MIAEATSYWLLEETIMATEPQWAVFKREQRFNARWQMVLFYTRTDARKYCMTLPPTIQFVIGALERNAVQAADGSVTL